MRLGTSIPRPVPKHVEIDNQAAIDKRGLDGVAGKRNALCFAQLVRQCELEFAGKLGLTTSGQGNWWSGSEGKL